MCGISGLYLKSGEECENSLLERMAKSIAERGPDAQGIFKDKNIALVHRRLSVIDLNERSNQPMAAAEGKLQITFNGEIYNFLELKDELQKLGHFFETTSDTEVILRAFEEWGENCFARLNGMFSFGLLDLRSGGRKLFLVRDRFGIKPLFYSIRSERLVFGSTLKPILQTPWIEKHLNLEALYHYLNFSHIPKGESILTGVLQLEPGSFLVFENGTCKTRCYLTKPPIAEEDRSEAEWLLELEEVLLKVVSRQQISDVPLGCFLSGGIDSSLLAWANTNVSSKLTKTFSIGYADSKYDETPYAKTVADQLKTDHHEIRVSPTECLELVPNLADFLDQPLGDPTLLPSLLLAKYSRKHVTVALSGDGGDELFFGYTYQQIIYHLLQLEFIPPRARQKVAHSLASSLKGRAPLAAQKFLQILEYGNRAELYQYFIGMVGPLKIDRVAGLLLNPPETLVSPEILSILQANADRPREEEITQVFNQTFLLNTVLVKSDRSSMAFGLETRVPFLDNQMEALSHRLPFEFKYRGGRKKYLLRELASRKIGPEIARRKKQGFSVPTREWLLGELSPLIDLYLGETRLKREGIFNATAIQTLVSEFRDKRANHSHLLWSLIVFQLWKEKYLP